MLLIHRVKEVQVPWQTGVAFPTGVRKSWANGCRFSHRGPEILGKWVSLFPPGSGDQDVRFTVFGDGRVEALV